MPLYWGGLVTEEGPSWLLCLNEKLSPSVLQTGSQPNPILSQHSQGAWTDLFSAQTRRQLEVSFGKRDNFPWPQITPQPPLWGFLDLY